MSDIDIVTAGAASRNANTNVITVDVGRETGLDGEIEPLGNAPMVQCLGVSAMPAAPDAAGHADVVVMSPCGPYQSAILGGSDTRCADVAGKLKAGETAIHNTGGTETTRSRAFFKENCASIIVGNDLVLMLDRKNSKITITGFGHMFEMSTANGISLMTKGGKAAIHLQDNGTIDIMAPTINFGGALSMSTPATAVLCGVSGITGIPSTAVGAGVYIRP